LKSKAYDYVLITVAVADFLSIFAIFINLWSSAKLVIFDISDWNLVQKSSNMWVMKYYR
jgi:hypothetical protein